MSRRPDYKIKSFKFELLLRNTALVRSPVRDGVLVQCLRSKNPTTAGRPDLLTTCHILTG